MPALLVSRVLSERIVYNLKYVPTQSTQIR